jgi:TetR/AcrR family fatty acid metabolism transcriptional regulator
MCEQTDWSVCQMAHTGSPKDPARTRQRILEAAMGVFSQKGYHDTAVDDIVERSRTSKGAFYFHFPNKQSIFLSIMDHAGNLLLAKIHRAIEAQEDPVGKVDAALRAVVEAFSEHRVLARLLLVETSGLGNLFDQKLFAMHQKFADMIREQLDQAIERGLITPTDTELAAYLWLGAALELVVRWLHTGQPRDLSEAIPVLRSAFLRSIGIDP